jgi:hypothetical protein
MSLPLNGTCSKVCPNILTEYHTSNIVNSNRKKIPNNCEIKPELYFDNIIDKYYSKGYRIFICEIGRGIEASLESQWTFSRFITKPTAIDEDETRANVYHEKNNVCVLNFGSRSNQDSYFNEENNSDFVYGNVIYINTFYEYDEHFVKQFNEWFKLYYPKHKIYLEFCDMTQTDSVFYNRTTPNVYFSLFKYPEKKLIFYHEKKCDYLRQCLLLRNKIEKLYKEIYNDDIKLNGGYLKNLNYRTKYIKYKTKYINYKTLHNKN